ncbi:MFS transporter [Microvirga massiliensis]|uniref:MFS transporter n=1 Tax=Microvirga massiliensis TaxID=1033741 RepID=UPI00062BB68E|nr:MFS transporter [Microvirga massiliensis]
MAASYPAPGVLQQIATRVAFFIAGFGTAAWAPLVPYAKNRAGLDDGLLGLLLLCLGTGSIVAMPIAGAIASGFGCRLVLIVASAIAYALLPVLATAASPLSLAVALLIFGAGIGTIDVAINIQAVLVEKASGRTMMSGFHGFFSVGGIAGAGGAAALLWFGASPLTVTLCVGFATLGLLLGFGRYLLPYGSQGDVSPVFALPRGEVLLIGGLCFIVFLAEGAMLDWSAVFLTDARGADASLAGFGYAVFAVAMTLGRLNGDRIVQALGGRAILLFGGLCAAAGLFLAAAAPSLAAALIGFGMVGLGASNIVPVLYSAIGRQKGMPQDLAIAAITTIGYSGVLSGPAIIGMLAQFASLPFAFLCVAAMLLIVALCSRSVFARLSPAPRS